MATQCCAIQNSRSPEDGSERVETTAGARWYRTEENVINLSFGRRHISNNKKKKNAKKTQPPSIKAAAAAGATSTTSGGTVLSGRQLYHVLDIVGVRV